MIKERESRSAGFGKGHNETAVCEARREASEETDRPGSALSDFQAPRSVRESLPVAAASTLWDIFQDSFHQTEGIISGPQILLKVNNPSWLGQPQIH